MKIAKEVTPSHRGELEITSVNQAYLEQDALQLKKMSRGFAWLDTGTHESLTEATEFVKAVEKRTSLKIACLEEIAVNFNWITREEIYEQIKDSKGDYFEYLKKIIKK